MHRIQNKKYTLRFIILICFLLGFDAAPISATQDYWPTDSWRCSTPEAQGMESQKLIYMLEYVRGSEAAIDSITIVRNGYIVTDAYLYPFNKYIRHTIHSCTKSVTSMLVGIAIDKGYIKSVNQPVIGFFPEIKIDNLDDRKRSITLENILTMSSGLLTRDDYSDNYKGYKEMMASPDWAQYVLDLPMAHAPGAFYEYSNCSSHLLSEIVHNTTKMNTLTFAKKYLFEPLGIVNISWAGSPYGVNAGASSLSLLPHDMAKLGLLYLNNGRWGDKQIVSEAWVRCSTKGHMPLAPPFAGYGYQWRISLKNYYVAVGANGQYIFVIPEKDLVVVFTSTLKPYEDSIPYTLLEEYIWPSIVSPQAIDEQPMKSSQLDLMISNLAKVPHDGFIWSVKENGTAKDGQFLRTASPAFRFDYPKTSRQIESQFPEQIMSMVTPEHIRFGAFVRSMPNRVDLTDSIAASHNALIKNIGGKDIKVIFKQKIILKDVTPAFMEEINFKQNHRKSEALLVSAIREGKLVTLGYFFPPMDEVFNAERMKEGTSIIQSLIFN